MKPTTASPVQPSAKVSTGIAGFDEITGGGLPRGRTSLLAGGPGSGKTIFALQFLVRGAQHDREPGVFVAFEESAQHIVANAEGFGWKLPALQRRKLFIMDAQPLPDQVQSGDFDLNGLLAALGAKVAAMGARRIVFDALDIVLALLPDAAARRREAYRLRAWLLDHGLTSLITAKTGGQDVDSASQRPLALMQFMVDCAVILNHGVVRGVSQRNLRVMKYRGSGFDENEAPFLIGSQGMDVAAGRPPGESNASGTIERVSSGVERLDTMLGGGYFRGASVLITGFSGTAKTTLSGAFAAAACGRGERTLFVGFDSDASEVIRNLASVGIALQEHVQDGRLRMVSARTITGSAESYLMRVKTFAGEHKARCLVIDPVSTWSKSSNDLTVHSVADRLIDWAKANGITLLLTSLLDEMSSRTEDSSSLQISTLADTWIHLSYLMQAGERNRGLAIIKSRGTAHSNQVRELVLSDAGVTLADTYTAGGEVLMGTMRWEKEQQEAVEDEATDVASKLRRVRLNAEEAALEVRMKAVQVELDAKQLEKALLVRTLQVRKGAASRGRSRLEALRGADPALEPDR